MGQLALLSGRGQIFVSDLWHENCSPQSQKKLTAFLQDNKEHKKLLVALLDSNLDTSAEFRKAQGRFDVDKLKRIEAVVKERLETVLKLEVKRKALQTWRRWIK